MAKKKKSKLPPKAKTAKSSTNEPAKARKSGRAATGSARQAHSQAAPDAAPRRGSARGRPKGTRRSTSASVPDASSGAANTTTSPMEADRAGEHIALRAFLKWQERGGDELSNWLDAEREVIAELEAAARPGRRRRVRR